MGEAGREVRAKEAESFYLCKLVEFVSVLVVVVVSEGCVFDVEIC